MDDNKIVDLYLRRDEAAIRQTSEKYGGRLRSLHTSHWSKKHRIFKGQIAYSHRFAIQHWSFQLSHFQNSFRREHADQ